VQARQQSRESQKIIIIRIIRLCVPDSHTHVNRFIESQSKGMNKKICRACVKKIGLERTKKRYGGKNSVLIPF